jgi:hypothetical protein
MMTRQMARNKTNIILWAHAFVSLLLHPRPPPKEEEEVGFTRL